MSGKDETGLVAKINDVLATRITMVVGSIWAFYAFIIFGLTPLVWPGYETQILYWSNFLQLIFLPVITVGTAILNRDSERRARQDHHTIRSEFSLLKDSHQCNHDALREVAGGLAELLSKSHLEVSDGLRELANGEAVQSSGAERR
ncbi:MAG: hypothetical protein AAGF48_14580 [Pseudomonadota bacterium]